MAMAILWIRPAPRDSDPNPQMSRPLHVRPGARRRPRRRTMSCWLSTRFSPDRQAHRGADGPMVVYARDMEVPDTPDGQALAN
jgi:hypothetical protein